MFEIELKAHVSDRDNAISTLNKIAEYGLGKTNAVVLEMDLNALL